MASDPDSCLPGPLKDFVFDLHDTARRSQLPIEQGTLYNGTFREITAKYFATSAWPSPQSVSSECQGDELFLALYSELTLRHLHSITRPTVKDRIEGWHTYRALFDALLKESEEGGGLFMLPEWAFDVLHEFLYQFQGFCQYRTGVFATAAKHAPSADGTPASTTTPQHIVDALAALTQNRDAWAVETVLFYLHRLVAIGSAPAASPAFAYLGMFSSVTLSRLECLLGDYPASLEALAPLSSASWTVTVPTGEGDTVTSTAQEVVHAAFSARLSMAYHAGVSFLMLRRYKDATKELADICSFMQRGFKTGQLRKLPGSEQFNKLYDRMLALLAILTHVCPPSGLVEDGVARAVREKYGGQLSKIEAGEEGYEDLFIFACPKFIHPAVPDYSQASAPGAAATVSGPQDSYKLQVQHFMTEMSAQQTMRKLRSYMKLYTSISVGKLAAFNDMTEAEFLPLLVSYKHKMRQMERTSTEGDDSVAAATDGPLGGKLGSALDIHYYIVNEMVHVDEAEKQRRFEDYFMAQISQTSEILKDVEAISTVI